jgi:hypothetical protein
MQIVNFTPLGTMSALQIAQTLETARQALISRGIATPTAQQIGATLIGGLLPTALGTVQVTGLVGANGTLGASIGTQPSGAARLQGSAAAGGTRGISDTPQTPVPGVTTVPTAPMSTGTAPPAPPPQSPTARQAPFGAR